MTCSTCRNYEIQLNRAAERGDDDNYGAVYALYEAHMIEVHDHYQQQTTQPQPVSRNALREIFGRFSE